ncbi:MAG: hypothetical protein ABWY93_14835 [Mycobacterium sp.]
MKTKREVEPTESKDKRRGGASRTASATRRAPRKPRGGEEPTRRGAAAGTSKARKPAEAPARGGRPRNPKSAKVSGPARETRALQHGPPTTPVRRPAPPKSTSQAKARAKARKAKAPKVIRVPLRERLLRRLTYLAENIDLNPRTLAARVPFVVLVIGSLGLGLGVTLWLSTDAAERSYELGRARQTNQGLAQQKDALERDVLEAQAAPALAEAARNLGMIPSRDTAHLVQDPAGNWIVVGTPKPAEGVPPPPLNNKLPDDVPAPPKPAPPVPVNPLERPVVINPLTGPLPAGADPEVLVRTAPPSGVSPLDHAAAAPPVAGMLAPGVPAPGMPLTGPAPGPVDAPVFPLAPAPDPIPLPAPAPGDVAPLPAPVATVPVAPLVAPLPAPTDPALPVPGAPA